MNMACVMPLTNANVRRIHDDPGRLSWQGSGNCVRTLDAAEYSARAVEPNSGKRCATLRANPELVNMTAPVTATPAHRRVRGSCRSLRNPRLPFSCGTELMITLVAGLTQCHADTEQQLPNHCPR